MLVQPDRLSQASKYSICCSTTETIIITNFAPAGVSHARPLCVGLPSAGSPCPLPAMGIQIQGMELFAIGVVMIMFVAVLKGFGILEPMSSFEGKSPEGIPAEAEHPGKRLGGKMPGGLYLFIPGSKRWTLHLG